MKIMDLIYPPGTYCVTCGKYIDDTRKYGLCDHCIKRMNFGCRVLPCSQSFNFGMAAMGYGIYERRLIFNLKYDGKTFLARNIAEILYDCIYSELAKATETISNPGAAQDEGCFIRQMLEADVIVPVPLHKNKLKARGFNQSEKIAKHLGKKLGIRVNGNCLKRVKNTKAQRALSAEERALNLEEAFEANTKLLQGKSVILLDDIYTTGATAKACAAALKKAGVKKIYYLSLLFAGNKEHLMVE